MPDVVAEEAGVRRGSTGTMPQASAQEVRHPRLQTHSVAPCTRDRRKRMMRNVEARRDIIVAARACWDGVRTKGRAQHERLAGHKSMCHAGRPSE